MAIRFDYPVLNDSENHFLESLILAQDERWRRVLGMQVERFLSQDKDSGKRVRNTLVTCPHHGHNLEKSGLIADKLVLFKRNE